MPRMGGGAQVIRPERVRLTDPGQGEIDAAVSDTRYVGRSWVHKLTFGDGMHVWADAPTRLEVGHMFGLGFEAATVLRDK